MPQVLDAFLLAEVVAFVVEAALFGALCVLYPLSIWLLFVRQGRRGRTKFGIWMMVLTTSMFLLSATHVGIDIDRGLIGYTAHIGQGPVAFLSQINSPAYVAKAVIFSVLTLLGDGFMAYRVYMVWERNLYVLGPPLLLLASTGAAGLYCTYALYNSSSIFAPTAARIGLSIFLSLCLATNIITTSLLLGRLVWYGAQMRAYRLHADSSVHWRVMKTIVLSEVWCSAALVVNLAVFVANSPILYVTLDALPPLVSISFTLIIVGVGLGEAVDDPARRPGPAADCGTLTDGDLGEPGGARPPAARAGQGRGRLSTLVFNHTDSSHSSASVATAGPKVERRSLSLGG